MTTPSAADSPIISVDAMGGDRGPSAVVAGLAKALRADPELRFRLHGPEGELAPLLRRRAELEKRCAVTHAESFIGMEEAPRQALRRAGETSMWSALDAVASGEAHSAVSCGNTGALMLMSVQRLGVAEGVDRPAIAVFWPSRAAGGFNIVLDAGGDLRADPGSLAEYAAMGAEYARVGLALERPRVGLLNVGSEETKGRSELREARRLIADAAEACRFDAVGFVEGGDLGGDRADVIVTDGFTGNIALKTAEGTAGFIGGELRTAFNRGPVSKVLGALAYAPLARMKRRIDPRRVNGGVFLGLAKPVVKSHGGSDATGVAAAVALAARMARRGFAQRVAESVAALRPSEVSRTAAL